MSARDPSIFGSSREPIEESFPVERAATGDEQAMEELFNAYQQPLLRMIDLRLDARLRRRIDAVDVLQEAWIDASRRLDDFLALNGTDFYVWLRGLVHDRLIDLYRHHVGVEKRSAGRELSGLLNFTAQSSVLIVDAMVGNLTSPSAAAVREEMRSAIQNGLATLDQLDQEILILRHYEHLSLEQVAQSLGLSKSGANKRHLKALRELRRHMQQVADLEHE